MADVTVSECDGSNQFGLANVTVRITNSTDRVQSYLVTVSSTTPPATVSMSLS
ncbi:MAG: hypothetical protein M3228_14210 [Actinomycetota bacterium]|nr:hypothetical protein [Actinomycetota bacterium]